MINWNNVLENFLGEAGVAIFFGFFLTWLLDWSKRPRLKLILNKDNNILSFNIRNNGLSAIKEKELNWHIYFPKELKGKFLDTFKHKFDEAGKSKIGDVEYVHYRNYNFNPLFPEREIRILKFRVDSPPSRPLKIYYHFSTVFGLQPRRVWHYLFYKKIQDKKGNPRFNLLPFIEIK